jgi:hypothetical protein
MGKKKIFLQKLQRHKNKKVEEENIFTKVNFTQHPKIKNGKEKYFYKSQLHPKIKKWKKKIFLQKSTSPKNKKVEEENIFTKD